MGNLNRSLFFLLFFFQTNIGLASTEENSIEEIFYLSLSKNSRSPYETLVQKLDEHLVFN